MCDRFGPMSLIWPKIDVSSHLHFTSLKPHTCRAVPRSFIFILILISSPLIRSTPLHHGNYLEHSRGGDCRYYSTGVESSKMSTSSNGEASNTSKTKRTRPKVCYNTKYKLANIRIDVIISIAPTSDPYSS
jgi:hypothetical protein